MRTARLARQTSGQKTYNVLDRGYTLVVLKDIPGPAGIPLMNTPWRLLLNGGEIASGETDEDGRVNILKRLEPQTTYDLEYPGRVLKVTKQDLEDISSVKGMQQRLIALGYNPGPADGDAGKRTEAAVRDFQLHSGLECDGIYGPKTQQKLLEQFGQ